MALNDVPKSGQTLNQTRSPIENNFLGIDASFSVDHEAMTVPTASGDAGKHKKVTFTQQGSDATTGATELALYTKAVSSDPHLFVRKKSNGTAVDLTLVTDGSASAVVTKTFTMPNYLVTKVGYTTGSKLVIDTETTVTFPASFTTTCHSVVATVLLNNATTSPAPLLRITSYTKDHFKVFVRKGTGSATDVDCTFIAYGD